MLLYFAFPFLFLSNTSLVRKIVDLRLELPHGGKATGVLSAFIISLSWHAILDMVVQGVDLRAGILPADFWIRRRQVAGMFDVIFFIWRTSRVPSKA